MIPRYARPDMTAIWEPQSRFKIWFEIEAHAADRLAELGVIPKAAAATIWEKAGEATFDVARIDEIEAETKHDVIAFLTHLAEIVGPEARFVHQGMTSSDVLDTCLAVQLSRAADLLIAGVDRVLAALETRAREHKHTVKIGRSHGIHAEPTTFGITLATFHAEFRRSRARLVTAREEIATCAISGAIGTFAQIDPSVEAHVAAKMGLAVEPVSTQVIPRDRHAAFFCALAVLASSIERLATEIRHMQRTEVLEAEEYFSPGQKGSSAMPHKRNPVLTENLTGLARLARTRHQPFERRAWHRPRCHHPPGFCPAPACWRGGKAAGLSRADEGQSRPLGRVAQFTARAVGTHPGRGVARGCLPAGAGQCDGRLADARAPARHGLARPAQG
jgi:adenylosuccinate lyase